MQTPKQKAIDMEAKGNFLADHFPKLILILAFMIYKEAKCLERFSETILGYHNCLLSRKGIVRESECQAGELPLAPWD